MSGSKLNKVIDIIAVLIAALALTYTIYQSSKNIKLQKEQTEYSIKLSLEKEKPFLQADFKKIDIEAYKGIVISNKGAGPAKILSFKYYLNQDDFNNTLSRTEWLEEGYRTFAKSTINKIDFEEFNFLTKEYVISPGKEGEIFLMRTSKKKFHDTQARKDIEKIILEIEYESLNSLDSNVYFLRYKEGKAFNNSQIKKKNQNYSWAK